MERNGFNPSRFETSGDKPDDSKEKSKKSKKKSTESVPVETAESSKKETVADRGKSLWEKLVSDDKEKNEKPEKKPEIDKAESNDEVGTEQSESGTAETGGEDDPSLEELSPEEDAEVTRQIAEQKLTELEAGRDETEPPEEATSREAAITLLERLRDEATATAAELAPDTEAEIDSPLEESEEPEAETDETELADFDDEQTIPLSKPQPKPVSSNAGSGFGSGATPPPRAASALPPGGGQGAGIVAGSAGNFNRAPVMPAEKTEYEPDYRVNPNATYLLVGGIVGYLIGRRRGRIKTEKRMNVIVKKLEKQVEAKQREIEEKTETVKKLARQNYAQAKRSSRFAAASSAERMQESRPSSRPAAEFERWQPRPEAARAETNAAVRSERPPKSAEQLPETSVELADADIRRLSETITIGATNLRKIHEARLITDGGLRRLVNEHLQGKDIRRGLAREFLTKELSYERDPRFRDIVPLESRGQRPQGGSAASQPTSQPIELAQAALAAAATSSPPESPSRKPIPVRQKRSAVSTGLLTALSFVALALAAYAVWLGLSR